MVVNCTLESKVNNMQEGQRPPRRQNNSPQICVAFVKYTEEISVFRCSVIVAVISALFS